MQDVMQIHNHILSSHTRVLIGRLADTYRNKTHVPVQKHACGEVYAFILNTLTNIYITFSILFNRVFLYVLTHHAAITCHVSTAYIY